MSCHACGVTAPSYHHWADGTVRCEACDAPNALPWEAAWTPADALDPDAAEIVDDDAEGRAFFEGRAAAAVASMQVEHAFAATVAA